MASNNLDKIIDIAEKESPLYLNKTTKSLFKKEFKDAKMTPDKIYAEEMTGVPDSASKFMGQGENISMGIDRSLGAMPDKALSQAIQNRSNKNFDSDLNRIQRQVKVNAPLKKFDNTVRGAQVGLQLKQAHNQFKAIEQQRKAQEEARRGQVLGSVIGAVGSIGGAIVGGAIGGK